MTPPLVSVCIPAYNAERTLRVTLESVLAQDYPSLEIVVSDNHSTDTTREIARTYESRGVRTCSPPRRPDWAQGMPDYVGAYENANFVLSQGHGEFLCLFHADDVYAPAMIRKQVALAEAHPEVGAVFTMFRGINSSGLPIHYAAGCLPAALRGQEVFDFVELFNAILTVGDFLPAPSAMLRRTAYQVAGGFDERRFLTAADVEMWLRLARAWRIGVVDEPLLSYRVHTGQHGVQYNKMRTTPAHFFLVMDHYLSIPEVRRAAKASALASYGALRAADDIRCAMYMLTQDRLPEARAALWRALGGGSLMAGMRRPAVLLRLGLGTGLLVGSYLGLGPRLGRWMSKAHQWWLQRLWREGEVP